MADREKLAQNNKRTEGKSGRKECKMHEREEVKAEIKKEKKKKIKIKKKEIKV